MMNEVTEDMIKYEDLNFDKICRICLLEHEDIQQLNEILTEKLIECASVELPVEEIKVCATCENDINKWYSFKQQVTKAFEISKEISDKLASQRCNLENVDVQVKIEPDPLDDDSLEHNVKPHKHRCGRCLAAFPTHGQLRTHLKIHKMEEGYSCDHCDKTFPTAQSLWRHRRRYAENKPYPCGECPMTFPFKHALDRHFQAKHALGASFLCSFCSKMYKVKETLVAHVKKAHSGETSRAVCNVCGRICVSVANLRVHLRSHTGERPFSCEICKKAFFTKDHMIQHRRIHTGERPYVCSDCGKGFISSSVLRKHRRSHTGERPYTCHVCSKSFSLSSAFKSHLKCH